MSLPSGSSRRRRNLQQPRLRFDADLPVVRPKGGRPVDRISRIGEIAVAVSLGPAGVKPTEAKSGCPAGIKPTLGFLERLQIGHQVRYVLRGLVLKEPLGHERLARNSFLLDRVGIDP